MLAQKFRNQPKNRKKALAAQRKLMRQFFDYFLLFFEVVKVQLYASIYKAIAR